MTGHPDGRRLADFSTPIGSGLTPAPAGPVLDRARAIALDADLRALDEARRRAWVEIREVMVR